MATANAKSDRTTDARADVARAAVAEHRGELAAHAARAVWRTGLRPVLEPAATDRSELVGRVIAQHPHPGAVLERASSVTLYVGVAADESPTSARGAEAAEPRQPRSSGSGRLCLAACVAAGVLLGLAFAALTPLAHVHALQAAGAFNGTPISGVQTFVDKLRGNLVWLGGTAMGLVIAVVGIMFMAGHSRAHDLAIRTIAGLAILASISGIVA